MYVQLFNLFKQIDHTFKFLILVSVEMGFKNMLQVNRDLHKQILCYKPICIEELKKDLKIYNVNISIQNLMTFLDDKVTYKMQSLI